MTPTTGAAARIGAWLESPPRALALLALWLLATLGMRPLALPDEGRYAEVARAMLAGGAWVPRLDGLPFFHKPPLFYWLDVAAMRVVGENAFAGRFGSAVGAWLMGAALCFALRRWYGARTATLGLGVLATMPFYFLGAQYANHDMLVGGLITAAVLAFARAVDGDALRVERRWFLTGWACCALAVLAKGLIGFVLPALVIAPWLLARGRWRQLLRLLHPAGLAVFMLIAAPWFVSMQLRFSGFFDYFVVEQHFRRFAQSNFNNVHGAWFFFAAMPLLTLPWSGWLPAAVRGAWTARLGAHAATTGLCVWWLAAVLGFFSLPSSKIVGYAFPALAPWALLLALAVGRQRVRLQAAMLGGSAALCLVLVAGFAWKAPHSSRALALALGAQRAPGDAVVAVGEYRYDVPFYARLDRPVAIVGDWADPELARRDNWRKEMLDAGRFEPDRAAEVLVGAAAIDRGGCGMVTTWFVVPAGGDGRVAALPKAERRYAGADGELWRVPGRRCR
jgi:4-amino-4-deoxy-L-arabinose transferase-like glycosyltransferase